MVDLNMCGVLGAENGSVDHRLWVKWVIIFGWVTWVMGHCQWPNDPWWNNCAAACNLKYTTSTQW